MIVCVKGVSCTGKSTLIEKFKNKCKKVDEYIPVKKIKVEKFTNFLLVQHNHHKNHIWKSGSNYELKQIVSKEYSCNSNVLLEVDIAPRPDFFIKKDFIHWLIDRYETKIFHLIANRGILDDRAKKRNMLWDKKRTERKTLKHINEMNNLLNNNKIKKYVTTLPNVSETDFKNNLDTLDAFMT